MSFSMLWFSLNMAINSSRNLQEWFSIPGKVLLVGDKRI